MSSKTVSFKVKIDVDGKESITSATVSAKDLKEALQGVKSTAEIAKDRLFNFNQVVQAAENAQKSISKLQDVMSDLTQAYQVQLLAETQLETIMRQRMGSTDEAIQSIKDYCSAQQQIGIIGDEVQLSGAQQMATFLQEEQSLKTLIPAMNNLLAQQKGLNATNQDAVGIGNLIGKVMQGQTSALKRVGISFTEAQEQVLKMGNEQQRAAMLAQVITDNVGNMNAVLAQTDAGQQKQLENTLGDIKEQIGAIAQSIMPYVTFAAQLTTCAANAIKLTASVKAVAAAFTIASLKAKALALHQAIVSTAQKILAATGYTAAAGTTALTVATAALYATLTCGISVALTALASLFIDSGDAASDAAKAINGNTQALNDNGQALTKADRIKKAVSDVQEEASSHYADEISKVKSLTSVIHDSNAKYADRLKAIRNLQSIIPSYHAQIQKDGTIFERNAAAVDKYIQKLEDLAMAEAAFDKIKDIGKQIVTLRIKQQQYKKQAQDIDTTIRTENGGKGADQLNTPINRFHFPTQDAAPTDAVNQNGTINFDYLRDKANAQVQSRQRQERLSSQLNAHTIATGKAADLGTQIDEKNEEIQAILGILTPPSAAHTTASQPTEATSKGSGGYIKGSGAPSLATPGKGSHATTHTPSTANTTTPTLNLAALRANLQAPSVNVNMSGRIRGRDIVTVLANETRTNRRPTNIHI